MNLNEIKDLIDKIDSSNISYFEVKVNDTYIKMDKSLTRNLNELSAQSTTERTVVEEKEVVLTKTTSELDNEVIIDNIKDNSKNENDFIITAPMVGTFYSAPGANKDTYVKIGDTVKPGDTLCIIEAMKLMNEIECEVSGEIVEVIADNGSMVEYGAELFRVRRL